MPEAEVSLGSAETLGQWHFSLPMLPLHVASQARQLNFLHDSFRIPKTNAQELPAWPDIVWEGNLQGCEYLEAWLIGDHLWRVTATKGISESLGKCMCYLMKKDFRYYNKIYGKLIKLFLF